MKKTIFLAAMAVLTLSINAQKTVPINFELISFNLDSLRAQFPNPTEYKGQLQMLLQEQKVDAENIREAQKQVKEEVNHFKNTTSCLKSLGSSLNNLEKYRQAEQKELTNMKKVMDKRHKETLQATNIDATSRDELMDILTEEKKSIEHSADAIAAQLHKLASKREDILNMQARLANYNVDIINKTAAIEQMAAINKAQGELLKVEIKNTEKAIKEK